MAKSRIRAVIGLLLNIFILPGLGSLIGGRYLAGIFQFILIVISFILDLTIVGLVIGIPLGALVWLWALITGISMIMRAR